MRFLKLFLSTLLLTTFSIGQTRGATQTGSLTFDFEDNTAHRTNGSNSYAAAGNSYSENGVSISCTYMDIVTNNGRLSGSADAMGRIAKNTTNSPTLIIGPIDMNNNTITGVSYYVKGVAAMAQICSYSTNGTSWTTAVGIEGGAMPTSKILKESETLSVAGTSTFYVKILTSVSGSTGSNRDVQIDDIVISYTYEESGGSTPTCATPTFSPAAGTFYGSQEITLATTTTGASIYYTLDGTTPSSSNGTLYENPFTITETKTLKAIAIKEGAIDSEVAEATYTAGQAVTSYDIDFETNNLAAYVNWDFVNITCATSTITTHGGTYYGNTGGKASASITTKTKYAAPGDLTFWTSKESGNTTASSWIAQVSEDGDTWTDVETFDATTGSKGTWTERTADLSSYTDVYVRIVYSGSTAVRAIDDISLATASANPKAKTPTFETGDDNFLTSTSVTLACETDGASIYYTINGDVPTSSSTLYEGTIPISATTTIKAIAIADGYDNSAVAEKTFTQATILTVAQARAAIDNGGDLTNKYVKGIISQIDSYNSNYHSITYWISDDGTTTNQLEVYSGLAGVVKAQFEAISDIKVGEEVIVNGTLKKYNSTYEFDKNNTIVTYRPFSPIAWSENAYTAELNGASNTFPTLSGTTGLSITYDSSDKTVATISADGTSYNLLKVGSTTISATSAATSEYVATTKTYTLTVEETVVRYDLSFVKNGGTSEATDLTDQTNLPDPLPAITKEGYNFGGWWTTSTFDTGTEAVAGAALTGNTTLYAKWLDPYSVGVALTMINALADNEKTDNVYVIGVVDNHATSLSSTSINYNIKDANASNTLAVYKGKGLKTDLAPTGEDVTSADYVQEGDQVVVYGQLYKYVDKNSNTTPEIAQGSYILSKVRPTTAVTGVTLPETATVRAGKTIALTATIEPSNASNKNVTWSVIAGSDYAEVDANGVVTGKAQGTATIQVETEDGGFTASCTVTVLAGVNFADGDWMLVTDAAELTANSYVIIAAADYGKAMKPYESGNNCKSKDATKSGSMLEYNSAFGIFEIGDYEIEEVLYKTFQSEDDEKYLFLGSNDNHLKAQTAKNANAAWTITSVSNAGVAVITSKSFNTRTMRFNDNSNLFACYASGQKDISLYKYYAPVPKVIYNKNTDDEVTNMPGVTRAELEGEVYKATISTTVPHRSGYSFSGWKSGETTYNAGEKYTLTADITLNAQWEQLVGHHVTYVATGTAPTDEKLYYEGDKVTLALATGVSNPGYSFAGWNDGTNTYTAGYEEYVMPDNDVTFTAVWSRMSSQKWALVEDVNNIKTDGTEYIIVATGYDVAMSALSGKIYSTSDVIKNENTKTLTGPESMLKLTFETGSESGKLAIKNGSKYISSTKVKEMTEGDDSFDWEISITDGVATISSTEGNIRYNKDYPRFTTYASGQQDVALYVKVPMVEISTDVEASALSENSDVVVHSNGTLTVDDDKTLGDLTVENGGKVVLSNKKLTVTNFVIETTMADHKSGQVDGALTTNFEAMGDAYIDITLGAGGTNQQWHAFTVPFPVDVLNGIYDLADNKLQNEVNYAIMDYHGDIRATGKYGWKKYRATLVPGTFYIMATDGYRTTYRFKKADGAALVAANTKDLQEYPLNGGTDEQHDNGWNGVGNPTLHYGTANQVVQVLNPNTYTYEEFLVGAKNFVVGTPFFVQAAADGTMTFSAEDKTKPYYAPARYSSEEIKDVEVRFGNEEYTDRLYISANEDALNTYETGKDLIKMTMTNTPKVAQIFGNAYNSKLCMVNAPLRNDQAIYSLTLYAPTDGEYTIAIPQVENADIYLTYDNRIIWNIAASEYNCELKAGETNNYGLILRMKAPQVTTGVEQGGVSNGANSVQKIIINDHVYILRGEKLYDVTGKMLR